MTEGVSSSSDAASQRAAEQARLRKERREAKIKAGGSSRLNKITGVGGRIVGDNDQAVPEAAPTETATATAAAAQLRQRTSSAADGGDDPDEVDISEHFYSPAAARLAASQQQQQQDGRAMPSPLAGGGGLPADMTEAQRAQLRQMMLGGEGGGPEGMPGGGEGQDVFMKMMSQMMGGGGGPSSASSPFAGMTAAPQQQQQQASGGPDMYNTLWRIVHALLAIGLGLYIVFLTPFDGTRLQRQLAFKRLDSSSSSSTGEGSSADDFYNSNGSDDEAAIGLALEQAKRNFFWAFGTAEAVLLTTKFLLDKGRAPPPGFLWSIAAQLPQPWGRYVMNVMRYGQIFATVRTDILLCAFVLGVCAWWKGQM